MSITRLGIFKFPFLLHPSFASVWRTVLSALQHLYGSICGLACPILCRLGLGQLPRGDLPLNPGKDQDAEKQRKRISLTFSPYAARFNSTPIPSEKALFPIDFRSVANTLRNSRTPPSLSSRQRDAYHNLKLSSQLTASYRSSDVFLPSVLASAAGSTSRPPLGDLIPQGVVNLYYSGQLPHRQDTYWPIDIMEALDNSLTGIHISDVSLARSDKHPLSDAISKVPNLAVIQMRGSSRRLYGVARKQPLMPLVNGYTLKPATISPTNSLAYGNSLFRQNFLLRSVSLLLFSIPDTRLTYFHKACDDQMLHRDLWKRAMVNFFDESQSFVVYVCALKSLRFESILIQVLPQATIMLNTDVAFLAIHSVNDAAPSRSWIEISTYASVVANLLCMILSLLRMRQRRGTAQGKYMVSITGRLSCLRGSDKHTSSSRETRRGLDQRHWLSCSVCLLLFSYGGKQT